MLLTVHFLILSEKFVDILGRDFSNIFIRKISYLLLKLFIARLATLPYGLDSNDTLLLANLLTKPSVFNYLPIASCNLVSIKLLLLLLTVMKGLQDAVLGKVPL